MKSLKFILVLIVAVFFIIAGIKAAVGLPEVQKRLKEAVLVEDGCVHPENEGKLVAVVFRLDELSGAVDTDLDIAFTQPIVRRTVQKLVYKNRRYAWLNENSVSEEWLKDAGFIGTKSGADTFLIDDAFLKMLSASHDCWTNDYTPEAYERLCSVADPVESGAYLWFSEAPYSARLDYTPPQDRVLTQSEIHEKDYYDRWVGSRRVRYNYMTAADMAVMTIVGYQQGNRLVYAEDLDTRPIFENASTKDQIVKDNRFYTILGMVIVAVLCIIAILIYVP